MKIFLSNVLLRRIYIYMYIVILDCKIKIYIRFRIIFNWKNVNNSLIAH